VDHGPVLVICGYLHLDFLAEKARERSGRVVQKSTLPPGLPGVKQIRNFSPAELEEYISRQSGAEAVRGGGGGSV
jgi:hypothetical protein